MTSIGQPNTQLRRATTIEYQNALLASAVVTGAWHDTTEDGAAFVQVLVLGTQAGTISIQQTDDTSNANLTRLVATNTTAANTLARCMGPISGRFWRVLFTNGATTQTNIEITSTTCSVPLPTSPSDAGGGTFGTLGGLTAVAFPGSLGSIGDNVALNGVVDPFAMGSGASAPMEVIAKIFGGVFSGTANPALSGWSRQRTPTVFKRASVTATGSTPLWTPGSGNKFRLLKYVIEVTTNVVAAAAGILVISLLDSAADIAQDHSIFIPAAAGTTFGSPWSVVVDLGAFGVLSAAANNILNANLSFALTGGAVNIIAMGTEE